MKYLTIDEWENAETPSLEAWEEQQKQDRIEYLRAVLWLSPDEGPYELKELEELWEEEGE